MSRRTIGSIVRQLYGAEPSLATTNARNQNHAVHVQETGLGKVCRIRPSSPAGQSKRRCSTGRIEGPDAVGTVCALDDGADIDARASRLTRSRGRRPDDPRFAGR